MSARHEETDGRLVALLDQYELLIYKFAYVRLGDRDLAMDCAQETFLRAFQNLQRGKPVNVQWLYRVARNLTTDEFRRQRRHIPDTDLETVPDLQASPEFPAAMSQAFDQLSPDDRSLLYLVAVEGRDAVEIAEILGIRQTAVRMRLSRARERFRQAYGPAL